MKKQAIFHFYFRNVVDEKKENENIKNIRTHIVVVAIN